MEMSVCACRGGLQDASTVSWCSGTVFQGSRTETGVPSEHDVKILNALEESAIREAAFVIRNGGLVAFPTETVYGLGADACNALAVARVFEVKERPSLDPLIVHVTGLESAGRYGDISGDLARRLAEKFWPGPLTFVVRKTAVIPPIVTAGLETVAIRVPAHPAALRLIREAGTAIAAPSANLFGYVSPTEAAHVAEQLDGKIDLILDGGPCRVGVESTIVSLAGEWATVLRVGGLALEDLASITGELRRSSEIVERPEAPGQLSRHYATRTPLQILAEGAEEIRDGERAGLLSFIVPSNPDPYAAVEVLSRSGDLREAAANLFSALRRLDSFMLDRLIARPVPEHGLGAAIMDRLRRCSVR
jgi:L-threonylcarbamoyladenylate synthase